MALGVADHVWTIGELLDAALRRRNVGFCAGFRTPALMSESRADAGGVRKAPRHENAVSM